MAIGDFGLSKLEPEKKPEIDEDKDMFEGELDSTLDETKKLVVQINKLSAEKKIKLTKYNSRIAAIAVQLDGSPDKHVRGLLSQIEVLMSDPLYMELEYSSKVAKAIKLIKELYLENKARHEELSDIESRKGDAYIKIYELYKKTLAELSDAKKELVELKDKIAKDSIKIEEPPEKNITRGMVEAFMKEKGTALIEKYYFYFFKEEYKYQANGIKTQFINSASRYFYRSPNPIKFAEKLFEKSFRDDDGLVKQRNLDQIRRKYFSNSIVGVDSEFVIETPSNLPIKNHSPDELMDEINKTSDEESENVDELGNTFSTPKNKSLDEKTKNEKDKKQEKSTANKSAVP